MELIKASLMAAVGGGGSPNLQSITITQNNSRHIAGQGTYVGIDGWNDISVAVPVKDEITGTFSSNGSYSPPTGKVWTYVVVDVDTGLETQKSFEDLVDFFADEVKFEDKELTWKIEHFSGSEPRTITFGNETIQNVYAGCFLYTWLNGVEYKMAHPIYYTTQYSGYVFESASAAQVTPQQGSTPAKIQVTETYSRTGAQHMTTTMTVSFPLGTTVEEMNDSTGYKLIN